MNAPVHIPRPELSDTAHSTTTTAPEPQLGWHSIVLLTVAVLITMLWNAALGWVAGMAFGLW